MKSTGQIIEEVKKEIPEVSVEEAQKEKAERGDNVVLLDVRDEDEYRAGYIPDAVHVTRGMLEFSIEDEVPDRDKRVIVYCAAGMRSLLAAKSLRELGYMDSVSMAGGYRDWSAAGLPTAKDKTMTPDQLERYSRHFMLTEVGERGQSKLLEAKVLLVGAGGLGSPAGLYLAATGVGTLGVVDSDVVELSNLQRQILHRTETVGNPKAESAAETIAALNPDVNVVPYNMRLSENNIIDLFNEYDLIVDGCDNFATRYLVNDAAVLTNTPIVHGSIFQFEGQATVLKPHDGPCYRCMYPTPPPPGMVPGWNEAGVLGVLPGTVGLVMATEAVKLLLDVGEPLIGRLVMYDALSMKFRELKVNRDKNCPICGEEPTITELISDYVEFCELDHSEPLATAAD